MNPRASRSDGPVRWTEDRDGRSRRFRRGARARIARSSPRPRLSMQHLPPAPRQRPVARDDLRADRPRATRWSTACCGSSTSPTATCSWSAPTPATSSPGSCAGGRAVARARSILVMVRCDGRLRGRRHRHRALRLPPAAQQPAADARSSPPSASRSLLENGGQLVFGADPKFFPLRIAPRRSTSGRARSGSRASS